jgi:group I intron endonuclease
MYGLIYKVTNIQNRKVYIGQTTRSLEKRKKEHIKDAINEKYVIPFHNALRKYGAYNFKWEILGYCKTIEELNDSEESCINFYQSVNKIYGYNVKFGGNNYTLSQETKDKIGKANKGKSTWTKGRKLSEEHRKNIGLGNSNPTEETRQKHRNANLGKHHPQKTKQKLREANLGKKQSEETIKKRSESLKKQTPEMKEKRRRSLTGKKRTNEVRQAISTRMRGVKKSEEHKQHMREANIKYFISSEDMQKILNKIFIEGITIKDVAKEYKISYSPLYKRIQEVIKDQSEKYPSLNKKTEKTKEKIRQSVINHNQLKKLNQAIIEYIF